MIDNLYYIIIIATFIFFLLTFFIIQLAIVQNKQKSHFRQELLKAQVEIQEQTFQHISSELHDNLGQVAILIKLNLQTISLKDLPKAAQKVEDVTELTKQLITDIRALSVGLSSDRIVQAGLAKALETEVERINKTEQFIALFTKEGNLPEINNGKAIILYRMAQEVLNNMVKHSGAKEIRVSLLAYGSAAPAAF